MESYHDEGCFMGDKLYKLSEEELEEPPYMFTGLIQGITNSDQRCIGTGTLISPNLVLTCAHNIFLHTTGDVQKEIRFYPRQYGLLQAHFEVETYFFPEEFREKNCASYDYALLKLREKVSDFEMILPLCVDYRQLHLTENAELTICGYP
jgi:V8-like Glu-specific endopeptidase